MVWRWSRLTPEIFAWERIWERIVLAGARARLALLGPASIYLGRCGEPAGGGVVVTALASVDSYPGMSALDAGLSRILEGGAEPGGGLIQFGG
jgi:hypothetical protein